jgi:hypothetical protein
MTGTIKKIIRQKGFGFIIPDDGSEDVFFHRGSLAPRTQLEDFNEGPLTGRPRLIRRRSEYGTAITQLPPNVPRKRFQHKANLSFVFSLHKTIHGRRFVRTPYVLA